MTVVDVNIRHVSLCRTEMYATIRNDNYRKVIERHRDVYTFNALCISKANSERAVAILNDGAFLLFSNCTYFTKITVRISLK